MQKRVRIILLVCLITVVTACRDGNEKKVKEDNNKSHTSENIRIENRETKNGVVAKEDGSTTFFDRDYNWITSDTLAKKKIIYENNKMNNVANINKVKIKLEGIQYVELTPSDKPKLKNAGKSVIIALTVKIKITNNSDQPLKLQSIGSFLRGNDNQISYFPQNSLEPDQQRQEIAEGKAEEMLHLFIMDKDMFAVTKNLELEIGPIRDSEGKDLFKGEKAEFDIPLPK